MFVLCSFVEIKYEGDKFRRAKIYLLRKTKMVIYEFDSRPPHGILSPHNFKWKKL